MKIPVASGNSVIRLAFGNNDTIRLVEVGKAGPAGADGKDGKDGTDGVFRWEQAEASALWTIAHNLGFIPNVHVEDTDGFDMIGAITHVSTNETTIEFSEPVAGTATLS